MVGECIDDGSIQHMVDTTCEHIRKTAGHAHQYAVVDARFYVGRSRKVIRLSACC